MYILAQQNYQKLKERKKEKKEISFKVTAINMLKTTTKKKNNCI